MSVKSVTLEIPETLDGLRLDKALSILAQEIDAEQNLGLGLSRSRLQALIDQKALYCDDVVVENVRTKSRQGQIYTLHIPEPISAIPEPQQIDLDIVFEDEHLIVVNKPVGLVVHPAPGALDGTLVNALLYHCRDSLSGIGGEKRPGIVHRIDKDTSGLLVVAKSDVVHHGLSEQFAAHTVERQYTAFVWRTPDLTDPRLHGFENLERTDLNWWRFESYLDRHKSDRTKMAVSKTRGRHAITYFGVDAVYGAGLASKLTCQLETGRTHQIRTHLSHLGFPLIGDQTYGRQMKPSPLLPDVAIVKGLGRQALHAHSLGFVHPVTNEEMFFSSEMPDDLKTLEDVLKRWNTP